MFLNLPKMPTSVNLSFKRQLIFMLSPRFPFIFSFLAIILVLLSVSNTYGQGNSSLTLVKFNKSKAFALPIDCKIGETCHVMNYVDYTPNDGKKTDSACLSRTYDTHKGTDFAILDGKTMEEGVDILAPLNGIVIRIRDGEPDQWSNKEQLDDIRANRKQCGNAILIDHGEGLETIYCHMKQNSITVKADQKIKTGDKIGEVGLSGLTEFPHLHFGVMQDKKIIDPFTGKQNNAACVNINKSLWKKELHLLYQPFIIHSSGFSNSIPYLDKIEKENKSLKTLSQNSNILTYWATLWGVRKGDVITLEIKDQNGNIFANNKIIQPKTRAQQFYSIGKNIRNKRLQEGVYTGYIKIERKDTEEKITMKDHVTSLLITP